jgi:hypothetical protein
LQKLHSIVRNPVNSFEKSESPLRIKHVDIAERHAPAPGRSADRGAAHRPDRERD